MLPLPPLLGGSAFLLAEEQTLISIMISVLTFSKVSVFWEAQTPFWDCKNKTDGAAGISQTVPPLRQPSFFLFICFAQLIPPLRQPSFFLFICFAQLIIVLFLHPRFPLFRCFFSDCRRRAQVDARWSSQLTRVIPEHIWNVDDFEIIVGGSSVLFWTFVPVVGECGRRSEDVDGTLRFRKDRDGRAAHDHSLLAVTLLHCHLRSFVGVTTCLVALPEGFHTERSSRKLCFREADQRASAKTIRGALWDSGRRSCE